MLRLKQLLSNCTYHPLHLILGVITIVIGTVLILDDHYFFWPSRLSNIFNSDLFGAWALFTGFGVIYVAIQRWIPSQANTIWLLSECGFMGTMCGLEISHGLILRNNGDHLILFGIVLFGILLFTLDIISKNGLNKK